MKDLYEGMSMPDIQPQNPHFTEDPILQALACICNSFSKSIILSVSAQLGKMMTSTKAFLEKYIKEGVICEEKHSASFSEYTIQVVHWLEIVRAIKPERIDPLVKMVKRIERFSDADFAHAVNLFFQGKDFKPLLDQCIEPSYFWKTNTFRVYILKTMLRSERMLPFLQSLNISYLELLKQELIDTLYMSLYDEKDIYMMEHLILENESLPARSRDALRLEMAIYMDFVGEGNLEKASKRAGVLFWDYFQRAFSSIQKGDYDTAYKTFVGMLRGTGEKHFKNSVINFYYAIALVNTTIASAQTKISALIKLDYFGSYTTMVMSLLLLLAREQKKQIDFSSYLGRAVSLIDMALLLLISKHYKLGNDPNERTLLDLIDKRKIRLLQLEMSSDFERYSALPSSEEANPSHLHSSLPAYTEREEWDMKLDELLKLNKVEGKAKSSIAPSEANQRIIYEVNPNTFYVQPKLQKSKDGVNWTSGRNIALNKFAKGEAEAMGEQDRKVATCVSSYSAGWYGGVNYDLGGGKALAALIGHPYVFDATTGHHLDVISDKPQLSVKLSGGQYTVKSNIDTKEIEGGYFAALEGNCIKVIKVSTNTRKTIDTLAKLSFPEKAKERLTKLLEMLSGEMIVMGDLLKNSEHIATRQTHSEIIVRLQPQSDGIRCQFIVRPFGKVPPVCKPGKGMQLITTTIEGKQVQTKRSLKKEKENLEQVEQLMVDYEEDSYDEQVWHLAPEECLTLLEQLQQMKDAAKVEWPEGEKMKLARAQLTSRDFNVRVNSVASWFELSGDVEISANKKMKIAELVEKIAQSKGNYVQLSDDEFVRISSELRRHIDMLARVASVNRSKMRISQFNAPMLESLAEGGVTLASDNAYKQLLDRINRSNQAEIKIPKTINADLRSYQKEGYLWMSRLALWGAGALLADDMGLGKTLQAITLMLSRASAGPQLVVVPTSVTLNWRDEIARFAPSLQVRILNAQGEDREALIREAKPFDVIITTYGLLINEEEQLVSRTWNTIVLDEAHTIKNRDTKMSQSAMKLKADFRLLLTGTPLQNHVSEMWNLMQFANPDLLGSFQEFTTRFLLPIERDHDKERQRLLKRIITPFILRRTKSEVLNELPAKTEITLKVDLTSDEWAFYDNIRQKALAEIEEKSATAMQALAEITRLRQAACNVRLVEPTLHLASSKLDRFMQIVDELHANHHRALVFSQFTSHLALVRERLDSEGVSYLYLDGSTSAKERIRLVEEYQQGDVSLFLISLKAGGLGLNLTAADYVVHLDPWWNPAIEEQASDRAYRIGQHKPVTVYRLISAGTIEEKIIELHQTKKNMADALLEGGDISASLSREEMIELLSNL